MRNALERGTAYSERKSDVVRPLRGDNTTASAKLVFLAALRMGVRTTILRAG